MGVVSIMVKEDPAVIPDSLGASREADKKEKEKERKSN